MSQLSPDARAVARAIDALSAQVKRLADTRQSDFALTPDATDDAPTTPVAPDFTSPIAGRIEVRVPCPECAPTVMIPRTEIADHITREHMRQAPAAADAPSTAVVDVSPGVAVVHGRPVALATPCAACGHAYNWHDRPGWCERKDDENRHCGCAEFIPGERPEPVDPWRILGVEAPAAPCAQHPNAPVIGGICGGCTQYPADMRPAPAADEDAQRTARRARLHNLLARADRSNLTPGEVAALRDLMDAEVREADTARAEAQRQERISLSAIRAAKELLKRRTTTLRERAERAEAAIERVRDTATWFRHHHPGLIHLRERLDAALDSTEQPKPPTTEPN
ncbi:hypothetical protein ACF09J_13895 [Streptomyces sp. NPDC014889]|uniref:hypothetical protein n=1 Tax=Streptomyces sp. NPDC014889 TaxID=3364928 RepID=UPI0036F91166